MFAATAVWSYFTAGEAAPSAGASSAELTLDGVLAASEGKVVVITMQGCGPCVDTIALLSQIGAAPVAQPYEAMTDDTVDRLAVLGGSPNVSFPRVFVGGKLLGGKQEVQSLRLSGALFGLLGAAKVELSGTPAKLSPEQELAAR